MRRESLEPGSFWLDRRGPRPAAPPLEGRFDADVAVVGAGIVGACVAAGLCAAGRRVVLLDGAAPGRGASGRNAGFLLAEGAETTAEVSRTLGAATARALRDAGLSTREIVAEIARTTDVGFARTGSLRLAEDEGEQADLVETARLVGAPLRCVGPETLPLPYQGRGFLGALLDPGDGVVDPLALLDAILARARAAGLREGYGEPVRAIAEERDGVRLRAGRADVRAERVVVTTNAWIGELLGGAPFVRPVRAQMLAARVMPLPSWHVPVYARRGADYWRLVGGTALLGGCRLVGGVTEETDDARPADPVQPALDALLRRLAGPSATLEVTQRWAGTMAFTADGVPAVGRVPGRERTYVLGGCNGHGIGWGAGLAATLVDAMLGKGGGVPACFDPGREALARPSVLARPAAG